MGPFRRRWERPLGGTQADPGLSPSLVLLEMPSLFTGMAGWPHARPGERGDTHPPVAHDGDDDHSDEEDQGRRRGADDEGQLLLDACLVLGWGESAAQCSQPGPGNPSSPAPCGVSREARLCALFLRLPEHLPQAPGENWLSLAHT